MSLFVIRVGATAGLQQAYSMYSVLTYVDLGLVLHRPGPSPDPSSDPCSHVWRLGCFEKRKQTQEEEAQVLRANKKEFSFNDQDIYFYFPCKCVLRLTWCCYYYFILRFSRHQIVDRGRGVTKVLL